jgi:glyoxylase-like metal-dependent hydrolase (beta-lactamase superfamily II)
MVCIDVDVNVKYSAAPNRPAPMNLLEQQLNYPLGDTLPVSGTALEVAPGVRWIRMGLPFALDHINLWLLRDELDGRAGWTIIDCCIDREESKAQWEAVFSSQLEGLPVLRVLVTHMHPDHIGLAHWLCERWGVRLWISATDFNAARVASASTTGFGGDSAARFFASHGLIDPDAMEKIRARAGYYRGMVPELPDRFHRLMDNMQVLIGGRRWRCISGYGHAPEHMALYCDEPTLPAPVLISGDMVLPRISTNISVYDVEPESNPLALFLTSIDKFNALNAHTLTLPSHGKPFTGLHTRIEQLHAHHRDRLEEVLQACKVKPSSAADILPLMFKRPLDLHQTTFAMGEAIAHLHCLWRQDQLQRQRDPDGIYRFSG